MTKFDIFRLFGEMTKPPFGKKNYFGQLITLTKEME